MALFFATGLFATARPTVDSTCTFGMWAWNQPGGGAILYPTIPDNDTLNISSVLWNTGATTRTIFVSQSGTYCVTVTFVDGCSSSNCINYQTTTSNPCSAAIFTEPDSITGLVDYDAVATGIPPFSYLWSNGNTTPSTQIGIGTGPVTLTITDATGCVATDSIWVNYTCDAHIVNQNGTLFAYTSLPGNTTFLWNNGTTGPYLPVTSSGHYCVTITNTVFGCAAATCYDTTITVIPTNCNMSVGLKVDPTGEITKMLAVPTGGDAPYQYKWDCATCGFVDNVQDLYFTTYSLPYEVTVTDARGCTAVSSSFTDGNCTTTMQYHVSEDDLMYVDIKSHGQGFVSLNLSNNYFMGATYGLNHHTGILTGSEFCAMITDEAGCVQNTCIEIPDFATDLYLQPDGTVRASVVGDGPFTFIWSDPSLSGQVVTPPANGAPLCVAVVNANGDTARACLNVPLRRYVQVQQELLAGDGVRLYPLETHPRQTVGYLWSNGATNRDIYVSASGTYCVTVTYDDGAQVSSCTELVAGASIDMRMFFATPGLVDQKFGDLWLIEYNPDQGGILTAIDTVPFVERIGRFENVPKGTYLLKGSLSPNSTLFADNMPTYWPDDLFWNEAQSMTIDNIFEHQFARIFVRQGQNPGGPGFIGGLVSEGANLHAGSGADFGNASGQGLAGVSILLTTPDGTPIAHIVTNAIGQFQFPDLAYGTYHVWIDLPGIAPVFAEITLSAENPSINNLSIKVDDDSASMSTATLDLQTQKALSIQISPNPATDMFNINLEAFKGQEVRLSVSNMNGELFLEQHWQNADSKPVQVNTISWPAGSYIIYAQSENGQKAIGKVVVTR